MEKSTRPVRNRRHSRRAWPPGDTHRPVKRLFTPEIKRMLKDWLVRRRDNPYPSRDNKKALAYETGLTYTQICNWFANWRRKLKNSGKETSKKTWGHLIKNYNNNAQGNVEQFSICSSDSIWGDDDRSTQSSESRDAPKHYENYEKRIEGDMLNNNSQGYTTDHYLSDKNANHQYAIHSEYYKDPSGRPFDHCYTPMKTSLAQCYQISSTTVEECPLYKDSERNAKLSSSSNAKYKHQMMEKYLRDTNSKSARTSPELSKWLESAANFTPNKKSYIEWNTHRSKVDKRRRKSSEFGNIYDNPIHQKEELDAAEALANLACNYRQRLMNTTNISVT